MTFPKITLLSQVSVAHLVSHIHMMILPALMPIMAETKDASYIEVGLALSVFNIVSAFTQAPMGFVVDKVGARKVLIAGLTLGSLSFISIGLFEHYYWLIVAMALAGVANSVYHPADYAILSHGINEKRMGRAFSIHTFSGFLGTAVTPMLMTGIATLISIKAAFITGGIIGLLSIIVLLPDNYKIKPAPVQSDNKVATPLKTKANLNLFTPTILLLVLLYLLLNLGTASIQNFSVASLTTAYHVDLADANISLSFYLFASALGVLAGGYLADKTRRHGMIAAASLAATAVLAAIVAMFNLPLMILIAVMTLMGFLSGIIAPSRDMIVRSVAPPEAQGRVFGIVSTGFNIGGAGGPVLFALMIDKGHPLAIFWSAAVFMLLTVVIALYQEYRRPAVQSR